MARLVLTRAENVSGFSIFCHSDEPRNYMLYLEHPYHQNIRTMLVLNLAQDNGFANVGINDDEGRYEIHVPPKWKISDIGIPKKPGITIYVKVMSHRDADLHLTSEGARRVVFAEESDWGKLEFEYIE